MKIKRIIYCMIVITLYFVGCYFFEFENKSRSMNITSTLNSHKMRLNNVEFNSKNVKKSRISLPIGYKLLHTSVIENTSDIGTTEHPTIDGGIINNTENFPISRTIEQNIDIDAKQLSVVKKIHKSPFHDGWATNKKVKELLKSAANEGKLEYVLKRTDQMGLPVSVAILPMVESQYQTEAVSTKGAAGAWQIMPSVAKQYGITNQERFQFVQSTDTALRLLHDLHLKFKSWDLAFAAYNAGSQRITNALQNNPYAEDINDLDIPQETKNYVNRIKEINYFLGERYVHAA